MSHYSCSLESVFKDLREELNTKCSLYHIIMFIYAWDWSGTKSTIIVAIYWPIAPALDDRC
jgi:hypothetical protein